MEKQLLHLRRGMSATEVIVAATLLLGMIGVIVPTTVRSGRVWRDARHYQIATNELSNQFELLSSLDDGERAQAIAHLQVSEATRQILQDATLTASLAETEDGVRLTLALTWERGLVGKPVQLVGWLKSSITPVNDQQTIGSSPKEGSDETT